jgi:hypothetical protein
MNDDMQVTVTLTAEDLAFYDQAMAAGIPAIIVSMYNSALKRLVAAEREKLAQWMMSLGYATGHGDTMEDLLDELGTQIAEGLEVEVIMEREACAKVCESRVMGDLNREDMEARRCAEAIRARGKK